MTKIGKTIEAGKLFTLNYRLYRPRRQSHLVLELVFNPLTQSASDNADAAKIQEAICAGFGFSEYREKVELIKQLDYSFEREALSWIMGSVRAAMLFFEDEIRSLSS